MKLQGFFTKQRYIILGAGLVLFIVFLSLAFAFGHATELGVLFIDLSSSAVTIILTALAIEYFQFREQADKTHHVASIAEEEIQAICYRVRLATAKLCGYKEKPGDQDKLGSLDDVEQYLKNSTDNINRFYDKGKFTVTATSVAEFRHTSLKLQSEIEQGITLFGYALPYSLQAHVLALRSSLQIAARAMGFMHEAGSINKQHQQLVRELSQDMYKAVQAVLKHESRTHQNRSIASKPGRVASHSR